MHKFTRKFGATHYLANPDGSIALLYKQDNEGMWRYLSFANIWMYSLDKNIEENLITLQCESEVCNGLV